MFALSIPILLSVNSVTILLIGIIASVFFFYILKNSETSQRVSVFYIALYFAITTVAFVTVLMRFFGFMDFSIFANNILYIIAIYSLVHGIAYREGYDKRLLHNKWLYLNILFIVIVNYLIFYKIYDNFVARASILRLNLSLMVFVLLFLFPKYLKKVTKPADIILKIMVISMPCFNVISLFLFLYDTGDLYSVLITSSQIIQSFAWAMALAVILMLDNSDKHYQDSIIDKLTGLYNRRYFEQEVARLISLAPHKKYGMIIADIDNFKKINDTYGHHVGDLVIQKVATCIKEMFQEDYLISRFGGEEYIIFAYTDDVADKELVLVANALLDKVKQSPVIFDGEVIHFTLSLGLTYSNIITQTQGFEGDNDYSVACEYYMRQADGALYQAKNTGKNKICVA